MPSQGTRLEPWRDWTALNDGLLFFVAMVFFSYARN
jgi:hypothetical protein